MSHFTCDMYGVIDHVSHFMCHMSPVNCHMSLMPTVTATDPPKRETLNLLTSADSSRAKIYFARKLRNSYFCQAVVLRFFFKGMHLLGPGSKIGFNDILCRFKEI